VLGDIISARLPNSQKRIINDLSLKLIEKTYGNKCGKLEFIGFTLRILGNKKTTTQSINGNERKLPYIL
jgi:hypothetical protein